jgi:hypothetical protein
MEAAMKKTAVIGVFFTLSVLLFAGVMCKNGNDPNVTPKQLALLGPKGGAGVQYKVGDSVTISWAVDNTIPGCQSISSVGILYSTDNGATFSFPIGSGSFPTTTTSYKWGVDTIHVSNQFKIKIYDYLDPSNASDQSAAFVITLN